MLVGLGRIAGESGQSEQAVRLFGAAEVARDLPGGPVARMIAADDARSVALVRADLGDAAFARSWAEGRTRSIEQAIAEAATVGAERAESTTRR